MMFQIFIFNYKYQIINFNIIRFKIILLHIF